MTATTSWRAGAGDDSIIGGAGNDILTDREGDDFLKGGNGNDALFGGVGEDLLVGGEGHDFINAGDDGDEVFGGLGNDVILGGDGDDELLGNEGNDWLTGGRGDDHLIGDNGNPFGPPLADTDTAVFVGKFRNYTITNNDDGTITVNDNVGNDGTDTLTNIERLQFRDRLIEVQPRTDIAADFGSAATQTIQTGASEVHSTTEQTSLTVNSIADGLSTDTVELTMFRGVTSLLPSDFHVV